VRKTTIAPGTKSSLAVAATTAWNAAESMGFSADPLGAEPVAVVVAGCDSAVVGSEVDEQLAITRATQAASPAWKTFIVYSASTAYSPN
jgi:hypothetical protein